MCEEKEAKVMCDHCDEREADWHTVYGPFQVGICDWCSIEHDIDVDWYEGPNL